MPTALPKGIGSEQEVDQANRWLREQPWYQSWLTTQGQNPARVHLSDQQRSQLLSIARTRGVGISNDFEIDPSGNINRKGHKLRNTLIGIGAGGAALTGLGLAGLGPLSGVFGGGSAAAGGAAGLGGVEAGAAAGLSPYVASGALGSGLAGAGVEAGAAAGLSPYVASGALGSGSTGSMVGGAAAGGASAAGKVASAVGSNAGGLPDWLKTAIGIGIPAAGFAASRGGAGDAPQVDPELMAALKALAQMQVTRAQETAPVHQAAQTMALRLAPGYARGGG